MFNFLVSIPGQILIKIQKKIKVRGIVNYLVSKIGMLFSYSAPGKRRERVGNGLIPHTYAVQIKIYEKETLH